MPGKYLIQGFIVKNIILFSAYNCDQVALLKNMLRNFQHVLVRLQNMNKNIPSEMDHYNLEQFKNFLACVGMQFETVKNLN